MKILKPTTVTDSNLVSTNVTEAEYAAWSSGTTYAEDARVIKNHKIWQSVADSNTNHDPEEVGSTWWSLYSYTNAWSMFDDKVGSKTVNAESIQVSFEPGRISGLALINISALSVTVTMTDPVEGVVFNQTISTVVTDDVYDLYTYFFSPFRYKTSLFIELPVFGEATLDVSINNPGYNAECGVFVFGDVFTIGETEYGAGVSIQSFSVKAQDAFGNYTILSRAFSKRGNFSVQLINQNFGATLAMFESYRDTPVVWVPTTVDNLESSLIIYGFYKDLELNAEFHNESICTLSLEGLT